ncbi:sulfurtransferase [Sorangium sp. So ce1097]|uniref:sulfurtransferase n=1 Tax=Sorangium sp. So ce1097 TaxID=3133330 RepID=UPI003F61EF4B
MPELIPVPAGPLVDVPWLAAHAGDPRVRVVDCRWYLSGRRGADEYARGHIPGAVHLDVDADLSGPAQAGPGRHPLPDAAAFALVLARIGVGPGSLVVAYDDAGGAIAARLWWMLRYFGHGGGRVLDGGLGAWTAAGHPLSTEVTAIAPAPVMELASGGAPVVDKAAVDRLRRDPAAVILDARARERYEGQSEPVDARPGHIPGARSAPFAENLRAPGGAFRERTELERRYRDLGAFEASTVVCYCGSGVTACHDLLALATLGREDAILYEGSWSDWARDAALPAATGPEP